MHKSVLLNETLDYLKCEDKKLVLDCTAGAAGHAKEIAKRLPQGARLIGLDRDQAALDIARKNLEGSPVPFDLIKEDFRNFDKALKSLGIDTVDAMLFDLGVSSMQLDECARGFSFQKDELLDMRMDKEYGEPLWQVLNRLSEEELGNIIRELGEERKWRSIARKIYEERRSSPIKGTKRFAEIIRSAAHYPPWTKIDPATRTFQAFRIYINDELGALKEALDKAPQYINKEGRIVVISFHSLEDRIVKHKFKDLAAENTLRILTKKPVTPGESEINENPRSRSAKLRAAERI